MQDLPGYCSFPDSLGDDLIIDIYDSKGKSCGRVVGQVASIAEDPVRVSKPLVFIQTERLYFCCDLKISSMQTNKLRWWSIYREPEHELVGRIQLYANYTTTLDENGNLKVWEPF